MAEQSMSLLPLYQGWDNYQCLLVKTIESLSPEQLAVRLASRLCSAGENAAHIVATRASWFYYVLKAQHENLVQFENWNIADGPASSAAEWTIAYLDGVVYDTDETGQEIELTRQWVIRHLIEHDLHHGGELSFTLGAFGLPGISL